MLLSHPMQSLQSHVAVGKLHLHISNPPECCSSFSLVFLVVFCLVHLALYACLTGIVHEPNQVNLDFKTCSEDGFSSAWIHVFISPSPPYLPPHTFRYFGKTILSTSV